MSSADIAILVDMGFSMSKAEKALEFTGNEGVEPALEWLLAHPDEAEPSPEASGAESAASPTADTPLQHSEASTSHETDAQIAKSLKCNVCGKLFKSNVEVEFHAAKSGHDDFSESTEEKRSLSEEEKKEQLKLLSEKVKQKRKEREEQERKEAFEREKNRRLSGKEMAEARKKLEELEMKKLVEQRKREKEEEKLARQRIKAKIEEDKAARRAKAAAESGQKPEVLETPVAVAPVVVSSQQEKEYSETRIQIRLTNGQTLTQTFGSKEPLSAVRVFIMMNRTDNFDNFKLMTNFPRKVFTEEDYDTPLDILGLVPSAVIIVQKKLE